MVITALECVVKTVSAGGLYAGTVALMSIAGHMISVVMIVASFHGLVYQSLGEC